MNGRQGEEERRQRRDGVATLLSRARARVRIAAQLGGEDEGAGGEPEATLPLGPYDVIECIGSGAMGSVYRARHRIMDRIVAIKHLADPSDDQLDRLAREANAMERARHQNVVRVHDVAKHDGVPYVAMDYVPGGTLAQWLGIQPARHPRGISPACQNDWSETEGGEEHTPSCRVRRSWRETVEKFQQAGAGLAAAHDAGVLHRDFKPENVLIDETGRAVVADFGLATCGGPEVYAGGSAYYMSPEHEGSSSHPVSEASDQFSFCASLYHALYGRPPRSGTLREILEAVRTGDVDPPPADADVPRWLREIVMRGMDPEPSRRFPSMHALVSELSRDSVRRRRRAAFVLGGGGSVVAALLALIVFVPRDQVCEGADAAVEATWNDGTRLAVAQAFSRTGLAYAPETAQRVVGILDSKTQAWAAMHTRVCRATRVFEHQTETDLDLRMQCLERGLRGLGETIPVWLDADEDIVRHALLTANEQLNLRDCDDIVSLRARQPLPHEPVARAAVVRAQDGLARVGALMSSLHFDEARAVLEPLLASEYVQAHALTYAEALLSSVSIQSKVSPRSAELTAEWRTTLVKAFELASAANANELVARVAVLLVFVLGEAEDVGLATLAYELAGALVARDGIPADRAKELKSHWATILIRQGRFAEAQALLEQLLDDKANLDLGDVSLLHNLAAALAQRRKLDIAWSTQSRAYEILVEQAGANNPLAVESLGALAQLADMRGEWAEAERLYQEALTRARAVMGTRSHTVYALELGMAWFYGARDEDAASEKHALQALELAEALNGKDSSQVAFALNALGYAMVNQERYEEAIPHRERAVSILSARFPPDHPDLLGAMGNLAVAYNGAKQADRALALLHEVLARYLERYKDSPHVNISITRLQVADVYASQKRWKETLAACDEAILGSATLSSPHRERMISYASTLKAQALLAQGRARHALEAARLAVDLRQGEGVAPSDLAAAKFEFARALWQTGSAREAVQRAEEALRLLDGIDVAPSDRKRVERWLASRPYPFNESARPAKAGAFRGRKSLNVHDPGP